MFGVILVSRIPEKKKHRHPLETADVEHNEAFVDSGAERSGGAARSTRPPPPRLALSPYMLSARAAIPYVLGSIFVRITFFLTTELNKITSRIIIVCG